MLGILGLFFMRVTAPAPPASAAGDEAERALVAAAQADPRAFAPLYERYYDAIFRYCYTRLGQRQAAEDVTAEVFLKAFANLQHFKPGVFLAWLYTIARHALADLYRKDRGGVPLDDELPASAHAGARASGGVDLIERMALGAALQRLPDEQRAVLDLQLSGWSGPEIAAALGKSHAAVKMLRLRAMARLRELLDENE